MARALFCILLVILISSCSSGGSSNTSNDQEDVSEPGNTVYFSNVLNIIATKCDNCHGLPTANGAPMSLVSYDDILESATLINVRINLEESNPLSMPQNGASLSQNEKDIIDAWIKAGMPNN